MFDTMTMVKTLGAVCGTFLVFLLGGFVAELIYVTEDHSEGHVQGYVIEIADAGAPAVPVDAGPPFEELYAAADAAAGEATFARACAACHKLVDGENATGPYLHGVVGRPVDTAVGYAYSGALETVVDAWTPEHLNGFITAPQAYAPGTKMTYSGLDDAQARANVIAYLATVGG